MEAEVKDYVTELNILGDQIRNEIKGLNDEAANWHPLPENTNSIYVILTHLIGSQRYWVRQVIGGEAIQRDREAEFCSSGQLSEVLANWERGNEEIGEILGNLGIAQLAEKRTVPTRPDSAPVTVRWCILHVISHNAIHLGHIQITRQLWESSYRRIKCQKL